MKTNKFTLPTTASDVASPEGFIAFVIEREIVRRQHDCGMPPPWTASRILQEYRFCNVRRRDDRVSRWLINNLYVITTEDLFLTAAIARLINWPPTIRFLINKGVLPCSIKTFDREQFISSLGIYKSSHEKTFTGAYMIFPTNKYAPKEVGVADTLHSIIEYSREITAAVASGSIAATCRELTQCKGIGAFMAGQVAADLTYLQGQLANAKDLYTWAPLGPGSQQGLNMMHNYTKYNGWKQSEFNSELMHLLNQYVNKHLTFPDRIQLTLHDVQNCLCEYSKFGRTVLGTGKPRSKYVTQGILFT